MKIARGVLVLLKVEKININLSMVKGKALQETNACVASNNEKLVMMQHLKLGHMS